MNDIINLQTFGSVFVTLLVIMDPPGALPIFLALTGSLTQKQKVAAARRASLVALGVIVLFAVFGQQILTYLHISLPALQGAGGLLLLLVALQLLTGRSRSSTRTRASTSRSCRWARRCWPAPVPSSRRCSGQGGRRRRATTSRSRPGWSPPCSSCGCSSGSPARSTGCSRTAAPCWSPGSPGLLLSAIAVQMVADSIRAFVSGTA